MSNKIKTNSSITIGMGQLKEQEDGHSFYKVTFYELYNFSENKTYLAFDEIFDADIHQNTIIMREFVADIYQNTAIMRQRFET